MSKNLLAFDNLTTQDGHGGGAEEHRAEMEATARRVYAEERAKDMERMEERIQEASCAGYKQAIEDVLHALEYDIESIVTIGIDGCREIFEGRKAQKYISDHIMKEVRKRLNGKNFRK